MVKNGKPAAQGKTKHVNIRFFFITDRVAAGEVVDVQYKPTKAMIAYALTKPLQGELFKKLRERLLFGAHAPA